MKIDCVHWTNLKFSANTTIFKRRQETGRGWIHLKSQISQVFTKNKRLYTKVYIEEEGLWRSYLHHVDFAHVNMMQIIPLVLEHNLSLWKIQHTHKTALWCCVPTSSSSELSLLWEWVRWVCSLSTLSWGASCGRPTSGERPSLRWGCRMSTCGERRDLFNGEAKVAKSIWIAESCFLKTFNEPSKGGSVSLTESTSGKSCVVAQKAASYSPNACSRAAELLWNGKGAFSASLCWDKANKKTC